jgi:hypothetical protein
MKAQQRKKRESAIKLGGGAGEFSNASDVCSISIRRDEELRENSFDSDTIPVRWSVEIP